MNIMSAAKFAMHHPKLTQAALGFAMKHPGIAKAAMHMAMGGAGGAGNPMGALAGLASNPAVLKGLSAMFKDAFVG
jgi:hypothetical protein